MADEKLEDAGVYVPYAKKHLAQPRTARQDGLSLETLWPEPDWRLLVGQGMPVDIAAVIAMIREGLATKPRSGSATITSEEWRDAYRQAILLIKELLLSSDSKEAALDLNARLATKLGTTLKTLGKGVKDNLVFWAAGRGTTTYRAPCFKTLRQAALIRWLPKLGWPESQLAIKTGIVPIKLTDQTWRVSKIEGKNYLFLSSDAIATEEEAIRRCLIEAQTKVSGSAIPKKHTDARNEERIGPDHRNGENVTPEQVMEKFGLRAIQFGNAVQTAERTLWINETYTALADLSEILGLPPKWIGLGGLAIAYGARGNAGAIAHFEPGLRVINLTRMKGAGSLAHEISHGLDNRLGMRIINRLYLSDINACPPKNVEMKYQQVAAIMQSLIELILDDSDYYKAAHKIARVNRAGVYWYTRRELFARAFEAYVQDALLEKGRTSPILVHGTLETDYDLNTVVACPYPTGVERISINIHMENLLKALVSIK